jgi:hypothetical protein
MPDDAQLILRTRYRLATLYLSQVSAERGTASRAA